MERFVAALPFELTAAQRRSWAEIATDLASSHPMNRLLQGDVGSGKTVVAALAALRALENGYQTAVMAPTEILAEQHFRKFDAWLAPLGIEIEWLSGSQKKAERRRAEEAIRSGRAAIAIGTHALFQGGVEFPRLALVVVDEQHRFGVRQRLALRRKGAADNEPHQLMMSATPIPRTLAMSLYADLDVSTIDTLPPGRSPIVTKLVADRRRDEVIERIRQACASGRQAYWVCPLIEESDEEEDGAGLRSVIETHARLCAELRGVAIGLVHGRLPADEKAAVMDAFAAGEVHVLVATTVVEVGVDVPNASVMVIEHAERFGLAQLHQLRGRVGRGPTASVCLLLYAAPLSDLAKERLRVIFEHADGFEIAERDLRLRGPGEVLGARQSGVPLLRFADLACDAELLPVVREVADELLAEAPAAVAAHLGRWLAGRSELLDA